MAKVDLTKNPIIQSPYTYLQAAGSDGSDKTVRGYHLRWDFLKSLGENHLAKGDYTLSTPYNDANGFNRPNDFVKIYRTAFNRAFFVRIDFKQPIVTDTGAIWTWKYTLPVANLSNVTTNVTVRFMDYLQYKTLKDAQTTFDPIQLLNKYTGIVEVETDNKLFFQAELDLIFPSAQPIKAVLKTDVKPIGEPKPVAIVNEGYLRLESVTIPDTSDFSQKQVSCRKKFVNTQPMPKVSCENIQYLRFDYKNANWKEIRIYCYTDFIAGVNTMPSPIANNTGGWTDIGSFALTLDDTVMSTRFMPTKVDGAEGHWPKFNDSNAATGEFTVNQKNYFNRWRKQGFNFDPINPANNDVKGLQYFTHRYMVLSKTDQRALASIPADNPTDPTTQDISYVDMLRLMSLDFHVARILGMGHIDVAGETQVYCLEYKTYVNPDYPFNKDKERTHIYMTPPVALNDYRLPAMPTLLPLTYGISVDNGTSTPTLLTDTEGYAPFGNSRFININRKKFNFEKPLGPFYYDPTEFCLCDETQPVAYGLEYKESNEPNYRKPEISRDSEYRDASGLLETIPILEGGTPKIYTHQEIEEGTHHYCAYAINWFSRVSPLSNQVTAVTNFPKKANLLPPFNFAVQLIQDEDPAEPIITGKALILTTQAEQTLLNVLQTNKDNTLVRATFDWNHVHHHAHQYADYAAFFFRKNEPLIVKGKIAAVSVLPGNRAQITTTSYEITSTFPKTTVVPTISSGDAAKFVGSFFSSGGDNYVVESVVSNGINPTFIVKQIKQIDASAGSANSGQYISNETFKSPQSSALFFITENMGALSNWDLKHSRRVYLEKFYTNAQVELRFSPTRTTKFDIKEVNVLIGNTYISVDKPLNTSFVGLKLEYAVKHKIEGITANMFTISGNQTTDFAIGKSFRVFANQDNDGVYTVLSCIYFGIKTLITVTSPITNILNMGGLIEINVSRNITAIFTPSNSFVIAGDRKAEINAAYLEYKNERDGTRSRFVVGGITDMVDFRPIYRQFPPGVRPFATGTGFIQLIFQNYNLSPHPDAKVSWYKGTVRLKDLTGNMQTYPVTYIGSLLNQSFPHLAVVIQDPGFIPAGDKNNLTDIYTVDMTTMKTANFHPGYKLYLTVDNGINPTTGSALLGTDVNFDNTEILPNLTDFNEGNRQTLMAIRSYDIKKDFASFLSNPVVLLAQKISLPMKPNQPKGPLYATRPDFYGKSTYTFDTEFDTKFRRPYSLVFYRSSEDRILDTLYRKSTQAEIWQQLNSLTDPKAKHDPNLWAILFNGANTGSQFSAYVTTAGSFTWLLPDNDGGIGLVLDTDEQILEFNRGAYIYPFESTDKPNEAFKPFACDAVTSRPLFDLSANYIVYGKTISAKDILKKAINSAFLPLNEQPPIFNYFKTGTLTSSVKAKTRDASGNLLDPLKDDLFPMIRILPNTPKKAVVRFTDYTLDGASKSLYFYRVLEMDDKFKFSEASLPVGPVLMVNAFPPDKPQVRKVLTQLQDLRDNKPSAVVFYINAYSENEKITKVEIYRATDETDALSIRTMKKARTIALGTAAFDIVDDFSDVAFPLYGEPLYYRLIAIRDIIDVDGETALPSLPSDVYRGSIVDVVNPKAPILSFVIGTPTATALNNVVLKWAATCYNGTYRLQKLNASGNWVQFHSVKVKTGNMQYPPLDNANNPNFTDFKETLSLPKIDADGRSIYHRFRVQVENSSGLFNLSEFEFTLQ